MEKTQSEELFCRYVWEQYLVERRYDILGDVIADQISVIGTGAHEVSRSAEEFAAAMMQEGQEWNGSFIIKDQWYQTTKLSDTHSLVIGEIEVREAADNSILYDIRFRFSIVLVRDGKNWKILHIHQSVPDANQASDEFFPHNIVEKNHQQVIYNLRHDVMTGLLNRLYLKQTVDRFIAENVSGVLLMIDIDKFKQMNDCFGHPFGDKVLIALSQSLKSSFVGAIVGRIGGDEFVIYLPEIQNRSALESIIQRFKTDWDERQMSLRLSYKMTVSMGVAFCPDDGVTYDTLWRCADEAVYKAKEAGTDKVCYYGIDD